MKTFKPKWKVAQCPNDRKWFVCGYVGNGLYIPVSEPLETEAQAVQLMPNFERAERAAIKELKFWNGQ